MKNRNSILALSILFLINTQVLAQNLCSSTLYEKGTFDLNATSICLPTQVSVSNSSGITNARYIFDYQNESIEMANAIAKNKTTNAYSLNDSKPVIFTVLQIGEMNGKTSIACKNITVRPDNTPIYSYTVCGNNSIEINIPLHSINDFDNYEITIGATNVTISKAQLPYTKRQNVNLPEIIRVKGVYLDPTKACPNTTPYINVPASGVFTIVERPFHPNIDQINLATLSKATITFSGAYLNTAIPDEQYHLYTYPKGAPINLTNPIVTNLKPGITSVSIPDSTKSYCFFVQRKNNICGVSPERSPEMCTIPLTKVSFVPYRYDLEWAKYPTNQFGVPNTIGNMFFTTQILWKVENEKTYSPIFMSSTDNKKTDNSIDCKLKYCYRVVQEPFGISNTIVFTSQSISNQICVDRSKLIADKLTDAWVSTNDNNKNLVNFVKPSSWPIKVDRFLIWKNQNGIFSKTDSVSSSVSYFEEKEEVKKSEAYKASYVDICNSNSVISDAFNSVFLEKKDINHIFWTKDNPFSNQAIKDYKVNYLDENTSNLLEQVPFDNKMLSHYVSFDKYESFAKFKVEVASDGNPLHKSYSNTITFPVMVALLIPNIFTPNGDSNNDMFSIKGKSSNILTFKLEIFNRFGEKVIELLKPTDTWDGLINGKQAAIGSYLFKLMATQKNGEVIKKNGSIELLR